MCTGDGVDDPQQRLPSPMDLVEDGYLRPDPCGRSTVVPAVVATLDLAVTDATRAILGAAVSAHDGPARTRAALSPSPGPFWTRAA